MNILCLDRLIIFLFLGSAAVAEQSNDGSNNEEELSFYDWTMKQIYTEEARLKGLDKESIENKIREFNLGEVSKINFNQISFTDTRPLILYTYHETTFARANVRFFIQHGLHASADFIFIINGDSDLDTLIPNAPNIRIVQRNNTCFDMGAIGEVLLANDKELVKKYKRFIFMNASIRGPFLPSWAAAENCWSDLFLNKLSKEIKLVGTTFNCGPVRHVQSMVFATDNIGIDILIRGNPDVSLNPDDPSTFFEGLSVCSVDKTDAIRTEFSITNLIRKSNYKVKVLMTQASKSADYYEEKCDGGGWEKVHPYETIFIKCNSNYFIDFPSINRLTDWHDQWGYSSWKACNNSKY